MADIFISHSQKDRDIVEQLAAVLVEYGYTVWWDYNLVGGTKFRQEITKELKSARAVIVIWSTDSVSSDWVLDEADEAKELQKLVPIRLPTLAYRDIPLGFRGVQTELADQPERIVVALNALGLSSSQNAPDKVLDIYWNLLARRAKPPGFLSRRSLIAAVAGGSVGIVSTIAYQAMNAKRYLVWNRVIHQGPINGIAMLPDGKSTITVGEDGAVILSNVLSGQIETRFNSTGSAVTSIAASPTYKAVYCTHRDGLVRAWSFDGKTPPTVSTLPNGSAVNIQLVGLANDKVAAILMENGDVLRGSYNESGVQIQNTYKIGAKAICAKYVPFLTSDCIVSYAKDATADVIALDKEDGKSLAFVKQDLMGHDAAITQIQTIWRNLGARGRDRHIYSFTASEDATIRCGDHFSRTMLYSLAGHAGAVTTLAIFDRNTQTMLASSGIDRTLKIWGINEKAMIKDLGPQSALTTALAFTINGLGLLAGTADGRIQFWDLRELVSTPVK